MSFSSHFTGQPSQNITLGTINSASSALLPCRIRSPLVGFFRAEAYTCQMRSCYVNNIFLLRTTVFIVVLALPAGFSFHFEILSKMLRRTSKLLRNPTEPLPTSCPRLQNKCKHRQCRGPHLQLRLCSQSIPFNLSHTFKAATSGLSFSVPFFT